MQFIKLKDSTFEKGYDDKDATCIVAVEDLYYKGVCEIIRENQDEEMAYEIIKEKVTRNYPSTRFIHIKDDSQFGEVFSL